VSVIDLPALDGRAALGFLAALGATRLLNEAEIPTKLAWSPVTAIAQLHTSLVDLDAVIVTLEEIVEGIADDAVIPGAPAAVPVPKIGVAADPMRVPRTGMRDLLTAAAGSIEGTGTGWVMSLLTDLAVDKSGRADITPFAAPSGQQSFRTMFAKPLEYLRSNPGHLRSALTGWRRVDGYSGEYLDHRAIRSAADHPEGISNEYGAPGPTWLALMALPMFRVTGDGTDVACTGWHDAGGRRPVFVWPLWEPALDLAAIQALLEHPAIRATTNGSLLDVSIDGLTAHGVFLVAAAIRRPIPDRKFEGVLAPVTVHIRSIADASPRVTATSPPSTR